MSEPLYAPRGLCVAASRAAVEACEQPWHYDEVRSFILEVCSDLLDLDARATLWKKEAHSPYTVSLEMLRDRLRAGKICPSPLRAHTNDGDKLRTSIDVRTGKQPLNRPLEDFEDLYYAVLARIRDMHQHMMLRIDNGFSAPTDAIGEGCLSVDEVLAELEEDWAMLNDAGLVKTLDSSIRRSRVKHLHLEILSQCHAGFIARQDVAAMGEELYRPDTYDSVPGIEWIGGWAPSMIGAWLQEKYRITLGVEREEEERRERREREGNEQQGIATAKRKLAMEEPEPAERSIKKQHMGSVQKQGHSVTEEQRDPALSKWQVEKLRVEWQMRAQRPARYSSYLQEVACQEHRSSTQGMGDSDAASSWTNEASTTARLLM